METCCISTFLNMHSIVPAAGPPRAPVLLIGEAPGCFTANTVVLTNSGAVSITEESTSSSLMGGLSSIVRDLQYDVSLYPMVKFKVCRFPEVCCTEEHPIFLHKRNHGYMGCRLPKGLHGPRFYPASALLEDRGKLCYYVSVPKLHYPLASVFRVDFGAPGAPNRKLVPSIDLDEDFGFLLGLYMGDGHAHFENGAVTFSLCSVTKRIAAERLASIIKKCFGLNSSLCSVKAGGYIVRVHSRTLVEWFHSTFGINAYTKRIPKLLFHSEESVMRGFFDGWYASDGSHYRKGKITSVSKLAIYDGLCLALRCGVLPGIRAWSPKRSNEVPVYDLVMDSMCREKLNLPRSGKEARPHHGEDDQNYYLRVERAEACRFTGTIYDKTTTSHTYCVPFLVHNSHEAEKGMPFVGPSGQEQSKLLRRDGINIYDWRRANVIPEYTPGNPDPTPEQIARYTPALLAEVYSCAPRMIVAVGRFAVRWFLGDAADMRTVHGIPHLAGDFDPARSTRALAGTIILPCYHPSAGLRNDDRAVAMRALISWDYAQVGKAWRVVSRGGRVTTPEDEYAGREQYTDISGHDLACYLSFSCPEVVSIDTEGSAERPWSLQVSWQEGTGHLLRYSRPDFAEAIAALQFFVDHGGLLALHNGMHDIGVLRAMGLDLRRARLFDTMYAAYLTRVDPLGLKALAWRHNRMRMTSYSATVGDSARAKRLDYFRRALEVELPPVEPRVVVKGDGTARLYKPWHINRHLHKLITAMEAEEEPEGEAGGDGEGEETGDIEGSGTDTAADDTAADEVDERDTLHDIWYGGGGKKGMDPPQRRAIERILGPLPERSLEDVEPERATNYGCADSDGTYRLAPVYQRLLADLNCTRTMENGMRVLPMFEAMQSNGMPASRSYFRRLYTQLDEQCAAIRDSISVTYFDSRPINPKSPADMAALMSRCGLSTPARTKTGAISTSKKSIEHLRYQHPAMAAAFNFRERQHIRDAFAKKILRKMTHEDESDEDIQFIHGRILNTRTATLRLAMKDPNLLAFPSRPQRDGTELGLLVRKGFIAPPGMSFSSHDFSQIEMRCAASESGDELLCRAFIEGRDVYSEDAATIFGIDLSTVDIRSETWKMNYRYPSKTIALGTLYGLQPIGLMTQLHMVGVMWDEEKCTMFGQEWMKLHSGVKRYIDDTTAALRMSPLNIVRAVSGMPRYLPGVMSDRSSAAAEAGRMAVSHKIQGMAQHMLQEAMRHLWPILCDLADIGINIYPSLQVHDELVHLFATDLWHIVDPLVRDAMVNHCGVKLKVPVEADGHMADNWGALK